MSANRQRSHWLDNAAQRERKRLEKKKLNKKRDDKERRGSNPNAACRVCKETVELVDCKMCLQAYHLKCLNPPQRESTQGAWYCQLCTAEPIPTRIAKILTWRWHEAPFTELDDGKKLWGQKYREYLCKFDNMCYRDIQWVDEIRMEKHSIHMWRSYHGRNDMDTEPETEDIDNFDDQKLAEKYYKYNVAPDWLVTRRVINHRQGANNTDKEYLVLWRELPYSECTWEHESRVDMIGFEECIQKYWDHRKKVKNETEKKGRNKHDKCK